MNADVTTPPRTKSKIVTGRRDAVSYATAYMVVPYVPATMTSRTSPITLERRMMTPISTAVFAKPKDFFIIIYYTTWNR